MWSSGQEVNEKGESVLLLEPKSTKPNKLKSDKVDPCASFIGGVPTVPLPFLPQNGTDDGSDSNSNRNSNALQNPQCAMCQQEMYLVIQMYAPLDHMDRTMLVFGCNNAACLNAIFSSAGDTNSNIDTGSISSTGTPFRFCLGGKGVMKCIRVQSQSLQYQKENSCLVDANDQVQNQQKEEAPKSHSRSGWGDDDDNDEGGMGWDDGSDDGGSWGGGSDWGDSDDDDDRNGDGDGDGDGEGEGIGDKGMDHLEKMLSAMEAKDGIRTNENVNQIQNQNQPKQKNNTQSTKSSEGADVDSAAPMNAFPKYDLDVYDEPYAAKRGDDGDSDDEDIPDGSGTNDAAIQKLLCNYLKEEEDEEVLSALQGGSSGGGGNGGNGEKYERAPPEERAFMNFTNRVKRAPLQSARYAYGGIPLWSIPIPLTPKGKRGGQSRDLTFPRIPPCPCGASREFEFQIMPSVLHILGVDNVNIKGGRKAEQIEEILSKEHGGMNWGTLAVYSCSSSCGQNNEECIVIQESADGDPKRREMNRAADAMPDE